MSSSYHRKNFELNHPLLNKLQPRYKRKAKPPSHLNDYIVNFGREVKDIACEKRNKGKEIVMSIIQKGQKKPSEIKDMLDLMHSDTGITKKYIYNLNYRHGRKEEVILCTSDIKNFVKNLEEMNIVDIKESPFDV
ncbi:hypothetical protein A3Q56_06431 [Intoshia linei]|uniref:Uncharacterized protein n=1 Tax=Intoshia linei TaxID=1819745 RepID=A0A177AV23_9BILA|nr:hypothetical protein A3Q56_06431 [Intoshia linei]